jgi:hypothetical protein
MMFARSAPGTNQYASRRGYDRPEGLFQWLECATSSSKAGR